jgi:hypothetical protein
VVHIGLPPPARPPRPRHVVLAPGAPLFRVFDPTRFGARADSFRHNGPRERFDHQRGRPDPADPGALAPADDPDRGVAYLGRTISGCAVEVFGDAGRIVPGERRLARLALRRPLRLLDLRGPAAMRAGTVAALAATELRPTTWAWARWFYAATADYGAVAGLAYAGAHNGEDCYALFERARDALWLPPGDEARLDDPDLTSLLLKVADDHNLVLAR